MDSFTRRGFVGLCAGIAAFIGFGGAAEAADAASEEHLLRPPGAQDATLLAALCVKCDRCRSICHSGVIGVGTMSDSVLAAHTPVMLFHRGSCDFCGECRTVCPTGAIGSFDPASDKVGIAIVQKDRCVAYFGGCTECHAACQYDAISLDDGDRPVVNADNCNGCGVCENICPALVYRNFEGGTRRGIVVVDEATYERIGATSVKDESEMTA